MWSDMSTRGLLFFAKHGVLEPQIGRLGVRITNESMWSDMSTRGLLFFVC